VSLEGVSTTKPIWKSGALVKSAAPAASTNEEAAIIAMSFFIK
jgi:hypothetical protein